MLTDQNLPSIWWEHMHYVALSLLTSLKGLHLVNLNESNICLSAKVQKYLSGGASQQTLELSYIPVYHFIHSRCKYFTIIYHQSNRK